MDTRPSDLAIDQFATVMIFLLLIKLINLSHRFVVNLLFCLLYLVNEVTFQLKDFYKANNINAVLKMPC